MNHKKENNPQRSSKILTVPNLICLGRIVGSGVLLALAYSELQTTALAVVVLLVFSDWIDGKLAIWLNQRSEFGAKFDTVADLCMYLSVLGSILLLNADYLLDNPSWVAAGLASYGLTVGVCLAKFGQWPSYHTRMAKTSWLVTAMAAIAGFLDWSNIPLHIAASFVIATNLETMMITVALPTYRVDVSCLPEALRLRKESEAQSTSQSAS